MKSLFALFLLLFLGSAAFADKVQLASRVELKLPAGHNPLNPLKAIAALSGDLDYFALIRAPSYHYHRPLAAALKLMCREALGGPVQRGDYLEEFSADLEVAEARVRQRILGFFSNLYPSRGNEPFSLSAGPGLIGYSPFAQEPHFYLKWDPRGDATPQIGSTPTESYTNNARQSSQWLGAFIFPVIPSRFLGDSGGSHAREVDQLESAAGHMPRKRLEGTLALTIQGNTLTWETLSEGRYESVKYRKILIATWNEDGSLRIQRRVKRRHWLSTPPGVWLPFGQDFDHRFKRSEIKKDPKDVWE